MKHTKSNVKSNAAENVAEALLQLFPHEKGKMLERVVRDYLLESPEYTNYYSNVWLWHEWPDRDGPDTGIDLVAQEKDTGEYVAIQCKHFDEKNTIYRSDLDSFLAASGKSTYSKRFFVATSSNWSKHAEEVLASQAIPCSKLEIPQLEKYLHRYLHSLEVERAPSPSLQFQEPKTLRPHQEDAVKAALEGFKQAERGKLIMACGTGKTLVSLHIAQGQLPRKGLCLYVAPSLSLLSQAMRNWSYDKDPKRKERTKYIAVCSDTHVGKRRSRKDEDENEDIRLHELQWSPTTDAEQLAKQLATLKKNYDQVVIFSTYQSLGVVSEGQKKVIEKGHLKREGATFDLVICDEAHRTTGVENPNGDISLFSQVHKKDFIYAKKRLYMTATPRLYNDASRRQAKEKNIKLYSMDDETVYGKEFYRLDFSKAVGLNLLSDYKVLILSISEKYISGPLQSLIADNNELKIPDIAKLIGCWNGLRYPEGKGEGKGKKAKPLKRAVAFTNRIKDAEIIAHNFPEVIKRSLETAPLSKEERNLNCESKSVSGKMNSLEKNERLDWLREDFANADGGYSCRMLTNARCLSEGIDVPALDAVLFLQPRASQVDIVQAVGRVMRKAEGKDYGYIILPIPVPADVAPHEALDDNKKYAAVWGVLQALRAHDSKFNAMINQLELNRSKPDKINTLHIGDRGEFVSPDDGESSNVQLDLALEWHNAIYTKIVDRCGDRRYWEDWADDIAKIAVRIGAAIEGFLKKRESDFAKTFAQFLDSLQKTINPAISQEEAIGLLSQHTITQPIFDALFEGYLFSKNNPISKSMGEVLGHLEKSGLKKETETLERFYESVRDRAKGIDNLEGKQKVMTELYEKFFSKAFPKVAEKLGIVYTPIELVDFILRSADQVLQKEFGQSLSDKGVHILDPFSGTGSFIARLLQNESLIGKADLRRKFQKELHANEIMLLAYYIAAINIEESFHQRVGGSYQPFQGIVLTDTFQMSEEDRQSRLDKLFPVNSNRVEEQKRSPIRVIVGNPPWSAKQKSENDANKNLKYERLDRRIKESYVEHSSGANKNSLYDSYIRSLRWASDRIGEVGVLAYVTNGSFIDGNASDGLRKCLMEEFDRIYCLNLRGNARTSGDLRKREGGLIFDKGKGSKATIAITILVKNPQKEKKRSRDGRAELLYYDIGDYKSREAKLAIIASESLNSLPWKKIRPNESHDWINQRDPRFLAYPSMGTEEGKKEALDWMKAAKGKDALFPRQDFHSSQSTGPSCIFGIYSRGMETTRDAWMYNFSQKNVQKNIQAMIAFYNQQIENFIKVKKKEHNPKIENFVNNDSTKISWSNSLKVKCANEKKGKYNKSKIRKAIYRPFAKTWLYYDQHFSNSRGQTPLFFPKADSENLLICINGKGAKQPNVIMTDTMPDLNILEAGPQCFALYVYDEKGRRYDNISDEGLRLFQSQYKNTKITKEELFYYIYAILHWPSYRERYGADLVKMLPRIPFVAQKHFPLFVETGRKLGQLHCLYESAKEYPVKIVGSGAAKLHVEKMRFAKDPSLKCESNLQGLDKRTILFNDHLRIEDIPLRAYDYVVNGRPAIEWIIDRYQVSIDKKSLLRNDPNDWPGGGEYILGLLKRVIHVSMESVELIERIGKVEWE